MSEAESLHPSQDPESPGDDLRSQPHSGRQRLRTTLIQGLSERKLADLQDFPVVFFWVKA